MCKEEKKRGGRQNNLGHIRNAKNRLTFFFTACPLIACPLKLEVGCPFFMRVIQMSLGLKQPCGFGPECEERMMVLSSPVLSEYTTFSRGSKCTNGVLGIGKIMHASLKCSGCLVISSLIPKICTLGSLKTKLSLGVKVTMKACLLTQKKKMS